MQFTLPLAILLTVTLGAVPPNAGAQADPCSGISGRAFGLCTAYCTAQQCQDQGASERQSCAELRKNFAKATGSSQFPCDPPLGPCANKGCSGNADTGACTTCSPPVSLVTCQCGRFGVCTELTNGEGACVDVSSLLGSPIQCTSNANCPFSNVCVAPGPASGSFCPTFGFCAPRCS